MWSDIVEFFGNDAFMPHATCFLWRPDILYTQAISDVITGVSYFSVATGLIYFVVNREDIPFKWFFIPFGTLVFAACGTVHFLGAWTLWTPDYGIQAVAKAVTAFISLSIGVMLWPLMPRIIALPSPRQFADARLQLADLKLQRAQDAVVESEERFKDFAESSSDWFWEMDANLLFTFGSQRFFQITGFDPENIYGHDRKSLINPDLEDINSNKWRMHFRQLENREPFKNLEYNTKTATGKIITISISGNPTFTATGDFAGYRGTGTDITERRLFEEQARRSQKMEAVGQLTGGIAHDFNNILGIVMGNLEILTRYIADDEKLIDIADKAYQGAMRGANLTNKLLGFSRKAAHETKQTSVNEHIQGLDDLLEKSLTVAINIEHHLEKDLWPVIVDPGDLQDAVLNISLNARDAMPEGGSLVIETANKILDDTYVKENPGSVAGEFVMLAISDTGVGMTEDMKEKVLEPFFTTKDAGKGSGLGLSMVYGFVNRSGGHMSIYSEPGKGTTVRLYLPRAGEGPGTLGEDSVVIDFPRGDETILVVDDEEALVDIAVSYLEELGYKTLTANNGMQALNLIESDTVIDLLFSDVIMPGDLDGYELALAAHEIRPALKVVLTSGFTKRKEEAHNGDNSQYADLTKNLLSKPYGQSELAIAIRRILDEEG